MGFLLFMAFGCGMFALARLTAARRPSAALEGLLAGMAADLSKAVSAPPVAKRSHAKRLCAVCGQGFGKEEPFGLRHGARVHVLCAPKQAA